MLERAVRTQPRYGSVHKPPKPPKPQRKASASKTAKPKQSKQRNQQPDRAPTEAVSASLRPHAQQPSQLTTRTAPASSHSGPIRSDRRVTTYSQQSLRSSRRSRRTVTYPPKPLRRLGWPLLSQHGRTTTAAAGAGKTVVAVLSKISTYLRT